MLNSIGPKHTPKFTPASKATNRAPAGEAEPKVQGSDDSVVITGAREVAENGSANPERPRFVEGEVFVKTKPSPFKSEQTNLLDSLGAKVLERFDFMSGPFKSDDGDVLRLQLSKDLTTADALKQLANDPRVEYAVPNEIMYLDEMDPFLDQATSETGEKDQFFPVNGSGGHKPDDLNKKLWGLHNEGQNRGKKDADIDAPQAWSTTQGSKDVVMAVIDTGVDYNHPELRNNMWTNPGEIPGDGLDNDGNGVIDDVHGYNAPDQTGDPMDRHSHGTHVAGTMAAEGDNGKNIVGVNWKSSIMAVKIFDDNGRTSSAAILRGIAYASDNGARITNNSWGGGGSNKLIKEAFAKSDAFHVMAAGNDGANNDKNGFFPANYGLPNMISVAATDRKDGIASFSNYGKTTVDIGAPGVDIYSTIPGGRFGNKSGTSMASPHVAGVAGLLVANNPSITNEEIRSQLMNGADRISSLRNKTVTGGRLNAANALENDKVAPGEIRGLAGKADSTNQVSLNFLAPGDDGFEGQASSYEVRVSDQPIQTLQQFLAASPVAVSKPSEAGASEQLKISVAPSGEEQNLHFAVQAFDNLNNASPMARTQVLVPAADSAFSESVEVDTQGWTTEGNWGIETVDGRTVFSDSPGELYPNQADFSLTSPVISLAGMESSTLVFEREHKIEQGWDQVHLEVAEAGEDQKWVEVHSYTGEAARGSDQIDLSAFDGKDVQVRFRQTSDQSFALDGFSLDNVRVLGQKS